MKHITLLGLSTLIATQTFAADVTLNGTINVTAPNQAQTAGRNANNGFKLLKVNLSKHAMQNIATQRLQQKYLSTTAKTSVDLGMNNVPVLDQGVYGTCVTFAVTAGIDAALGKGDYVSPLCALQLGTYLEDNSYQMSGWEGSWARTVLSQYTNNGIISKEQEQKLGCGGMYSYPIHDDVSGQMNVAEYHEMSKPLGNDMFMIDWSPIFDVYNAFDNTQAAKHVNDIKQALNEGERVTVGVLLVDFNQGIAGAVGMHKSTLDTWVLTPDMINDLQTKDINDIVAGHEMLIIGYDDNATATDNEGRTYKGLFKLRNSWGKRYGDNGDFYMTYDYFKTLGLEAYRIKG